MVDYQYNSFCRAMEDQVLATHPSGKIIPYIGAFWRDITWSTNVHIGRIVEDGNEPLVQGPFFIGFMANNKWGYPERILPTEEKVHVISLLDTAMLSDNKVVKARTLQHLWDYMQTLSVEYKGTGPNSRGYHFFFFIPIRTK